MFDHVPEPIRSLLRRDMQIGMAEAVVAMAEEQVKTRQCTISPDDKDVPCKFCGHPGGSGHGKER